MNDPKQELEELCYLTAQSMTSLVTSEHFKVIKKLGQGSYGKVMLAVHRQKGTPMALKFFPRSSTTLHSFLREYNLSVSFCTHPSLTRALGIFFSTPSHYVFAQQAALYGDLYDVIVSEAGVREEQVQCVMSQLSGAVSYLHSLGFVHRDIKPENVFLCDPRCHWVKLGDFGLVRAQGSQVRAVWYDSPFCVPEMEQAKERKTGSGEEQEEEMDDIWVLVEPSLDSWALGILIYCLLTSCFPWDESTSDDPAFRVFIDWFNRTQATEKKDTRANKHGDNRKQGGDICSTKAREKRKGGEEEQDAVVVPPQFESLSSLALTLLRQLLHPVPQLRAGPEEVLSYLGGAWLLQTEQEEKRREQEAQEEARKVRGGGVDNRREGRGER